MISTPPAAPDPADPATYDSRAPAFAAWFEAAVAEFNALAGSADVSANFLDQITIDAAGVGAVEFTDDGGATVPGSISYDHATDEMIFTAGGVEVWRLPAVGGGAGSLDAVVLTLVVADQSISANTEGTIVWDTVEFDPGGHMPSPGSTFTVPDGWTRVQVGLAVEYQKISTAPWHDARVYRNGALAHRTLRHQTSQDVAAKMMGDVFELDVSSGDTLDARFFNHQGVSATVERGSFFSIQKIA